MNLLVSGAAGFIGSHLCDRLLAEGHSVLGLDNLLTGSRDNIAHLERHSRFEFRRQDVGKSFEANGNFDGVLHLASPASPKDYLGLPVETLEVSSCGTRNMLEVARRCNARFLLTSTSEAYGDPAEHPQSESYWGHVNPVGLRSCYDEGKRFAEALTMAYHRTFGLRTSIARIFNTYGPRMKLKDGRVVPTFLDQALRRQPVTVFGDGTQTRSFCYVSDMVEGLYRLFLSEERYPINLGNPVEISIREFAEYVCRLTGAPFKAEYKPLPADDPKKRRPDISKARKSLGWEPHVSLEDGIRKTIEYFRPRMTFI